MVAPTRKQPRHRAHVGGGEVSSMTRKTKQPRLLPRLEPIAETDALTLDEIIPAPVSLVSPKEIPNVMAFKLHKGVDGVLAVSDDDMRAFLQTGVTEHDRMIHKLTTLAAKLDRVLVAPPKAEPVLGEGKAWN